MFSLGAVDVCQDVLLHHPRAAAVILHDLDDHGALVGAQLVVVESQLRRERKWER